MAASDVTDQLVADLRGIVADLAKTVNEWPERMNAALDKRQYVDMKTFQLNMELINKTIAAEVDARISAVAAEAQKREADDTTEKTARETLATTVATMSRRALTVIGALASALLVGFVTFLVFLAEMGVHPK